MSFSGNVKKELAELIPPAPHCRVAGLAAMLEYMGEFCKRETGEWELFLETENRDALGKCFTLLSKTSNISCEMVQQENIRSKKKRARAKAVSEQVRALAEMLHFPGENGELPCAGSGVAEELIRQECCCKSFLRDSFLCIGSMSDPRKEYHLEFDCQTRQQAEQIQRVLGRLDIDARMIRRKKYHVIYLKDSAVIADVLNYLGAHSSMMDMENSLILKEMRNSINRRVNCETANIEKTVNAAQRQIEDIRFLESHDMLRSLSETLRSVAETRIEHPDATLKEIGDILTPPVGKSGVNHRLRKLSEIADRLREERGL